MILNTFAILDAAVALLSLGVGLLVIGLGATGWRRTRRAAVPEERAALEDRNYLLSMLALWLLGLNVVSWPLFYLLLQSYVAEWPGVMCIYGVTQVGAGSAGSSRFLPGLLAALQVLKPLEVFACGVWFVLYLLNRATPTGPLLGRLLLVLVLGGTLSVATAGIELAYLVIPKKDEAPATGCCTVSTAARAGIWGTIAEIVDQPAAHPWLYAAFYASSGMMVLALASHLDRSRRAPSRLALAGLCAGACASLLAAGAFLGEIAAPAVLHLPYHHCPYDLVPRAPDMVIGAALFIGGVFAVGWATVAGWCGRTPEAAIVRPQLIGRLLFLGLCGYVGALVLVSVELALA